MKIAVVGGTHGNEFTGVEVCKALEKSQQSYKNEYRTFIANPMAHLKKIRYVDSDLNRAYSKTSTPLGNEKERSDFLKAEIMGKFDFLIDLHTTTSNMGSTLILTDTNPKSLNAACFIKKNFPHYKLIFAASGDDPYYTTNLTKAGLTVEVGPIANNIVKASLVLDNLEIVSALLDYDFQTEFDYADFEVFSEIDKICYPEKEGYYIHPDLEGKDFQALKTGDPIFIDAKKNTIKFEYAGHDLVYPMFINEAAYLEKNIAFEICEKIKLSEVLRV